jgi:hypothetical protein
MMHVNKLPDVIDTINENRLDAGVLRIDPIKFVGSTKHKTASLKETAVADRCVKLLRSLTSIATFVTREIVPIDSAEACSTTNPPLKAS